MRKFFVVLMMFLLSSNVMAQGNIFLPGATPNGVLYAMPASPNPKLSALGTANNGVLCTDATGAPSICSALPPAVGAQLTVVNIAALKALTTRPLTVWVQGVTTAGDCGFGTWDWYAGDTTTADDAMVVNPTTGTAGRYKRRVEPQTVSLCAMLAKANPLQSALDYLGAAGGLVTVQAGTWVIPSAVTSAANLNGLTIRGDSTFSALVFTSAGISLTMASELSTITNQQKVSIENVHLLVDRYASTSGLNGSGAAISISWPLALGVVPSYVNFRDVQFGSYNREASGGLYSWWDTGIFLYNARNVNLDNVTGWGSSGNRKGIGIDLAGGTIQIQNSNINLSDLERGYYVNGVVEGFHVEGGKGACVNTDYCYYIDGDALGRARTTSTTSHTIGTGSKTFTTADTLGPPSGVIFQTGQTLYIFDTLNSRPSYLGHTNWMYGTVTSVTSNTVTVNVTNTSGAGTLASWNISAQHKISDIKISGTHSSSAKGHLYARWTAFGSLGPTESQQREGTAETFADVEFVDNNSYWTVGPAQFMGAVASSVNPRNGVVVRGGAAWIDNVQIGVKDIVFDFRDKGVVFEQTAYGYIDRIFAAGATVTTLIDNQSGTNGLFTWVSPTSYNAFTQTTWYTAFTANDTTPSVAGNGQNYWRTANSASTSITALDDGAIGQLSTIVVNDANTTFVHSSTLILRDGVDFSPPSGTVMQFVRETSTVQREVSRNTSAAIPLTALATQAANTVVGNATSGSASPTALAMTSCSTAGSAVSWTTNTGFGCNTSITAAAVAVGGITGLGTGVATWLATPSSANLASAVTDETGSGALVFADTPTLVTPSIGAATGLSLTLSTGAQTSLVLDNESGSFTEFNIVSLNGNRTLAGAIGILGGKTSPADLNLYHLVPTGGVHQFLINGVAGLTASATLTNITAALTVGTTVTLTAPGADTGLTDTTLCHVTATGQVKTGTGASGICLGTSTEKAKDNIVPLTAGLNKIMNLRPVSYTSRDMPGRPTHYWFTAERMAQDMPELTHYNDNGEPISVDGMALIPFLVNAAKELKAANDNLTIQLDQLKKKVK